MHEQSGAPRFGTRRLFPVLAALLVLAFGAWLRLDALDWDGLAGLQPDERFLIFRVTDSLNALRGSDMPLWQLWFDSAGSPLNPRNHDAFYVYGDLPHLLMVTAAWASGAEGWEQPLLLARSLSAAADTLTILAAFLLGARWGGNAWCGTAAAFFYACLPLAVQGAHFFTVDPFLTLFAAVTLAGLSHGGRGGWAAGGIGFGLALACKISALALAPLFLLAAFLHGRRALPHLALAILAGAATLRLASPFLFDGPVMPDPRFTAALGQLAAMAADWPGAPPQWSWVDRTPVLPPLRDLALLGIAPGAVIALLMGLRRIRATAWLGVATALVVLGPMFAHAAPAIRYALPAGPAIAGLAGLAVLARPRWLLAVALVASGLMSDGVRRMLALPHTRIEASLWIWAHLPPGALIVNETAWDEGLPVPVALPGDTARRWPFTDAGFRGATLELTDPPGSEKAARIAALLATADLLVESSARMSATIPRIPAHRPIAAAFYRLRDSGNLCYEEVARFTRGIPILGLFEINDSWAQEPWTVYDHPTVRLFRRLPCFDEAAIEAALQ